MELTKIQQMINSFKVFLTTGLEKGGLSVLIIIQDLFLV